MNMTTEQKLLKAIKDLRDAGKSVEDVVTALLVVRNLEEPAK
jgi:hypothetical protein